MPGRVFLLCRLVLPISIHPPYLYPYLYPYAYLYTTPTLYTLQYPYSTRLQLVLKYNRKHRLPRPRRLLPTNQQTLGLAQVPHLHNSLLHRHDILHAPHTTPTPPTARNPLPLVPSPDNPDHHLRGADPSRPDPARHGGN